MNIYIGNLDYRVRENDLRQVMEEYGTVDSVKIIMDRETGKSKGFAFVEMQNEEEANKAISELNQAEFEGRTMVVKAALPRENNTPRPSNNNRGYKSYNNSYNRR